MTKTQADLAQRIGEQLPYLRRYARALTGSQTTGDAYAAATLEAILEDRSVFEGARSPKVALFRAFHLIWSSAGAPIAEAVGDVLERRAQVHLGTLTRNTREALLLRTVEEFSFEEIAEIMQISAAEAEELLATALNEMEESLLGKIMIIEDEAIIAMDIHSIVTGMGHRVTGNARTRDAAVALGQKDRPDLILADIQLADGSSGIDAVNELLQILGDVPVIFITAFPQRLLTGERPEPAFLITKPYSEEQVRSAVSQAMFFASTEDMRV
ncbi:response regulator [Haematobacter missouriensis]|uniref:Response regulator n=1 Tax=Haematobacter missouriensis TaxID=366616 RepID=A0A212AVZ0_9RHOB|nr:response regulator [Haematobacter missouriensis]OWJ85639.1 response regulator [Haematobacter missouriensis]